MSFSDVNFKKYYLKLKQSTCDTAKDESEI